MSGVTTTADEPQRTDINRPMITIAIMLATLIVSIDGTIANVALPHMQGSLNASQDQITWVLTSFIVATAIATPMTGWLSDRFGQKQVFLVSIFGFTVASMLCGVSGSLAEIVGARLLQGVFGAALVPLSQSTLLDINPREKHGSAMAVWGMGVMVGPILGPTLGGWLTDAYDWRWCFFINVPIGAAAFFGILKFIPHQFAQRKIRFDVLGFTCLSLTIGALQLLLDRGQQNDWFNSAETCIEAAVCFISLGFFIIHTATKPAGSTFFNYRLLMNRNFLTGLLFIFIVGMVLFATRALLPSMLQGLMGYTALYAGLITAPSGLGTMLAMMIVGRMVGKVDLRLILAVGFGLTALTLWMMCGYTVDTSQRAVVIPSIIQGFGLGLVFVPLSAATFATLPGDLRPDGTSIYSLVRNIGSSIGIAMVQALQVSNTQKAHSGIVANITANHPRLIENTSGLVGLNGEVTRQASMIAYIDNFWLMMILTLLAMPLLLVIKAPKKKAASNDDSHLEMAALE
ncbi:DHA2 family efflux MFS transporter permease subunit [Asticcacaulis sp. EMRT-3]|uniref:DHA2 family efflux MFS transporter permease subunit n=1 Tax=Asticcacaulis sp. EMRT-3 TaxID=3040349 RepID=UPI0024AEF905|nr:DHA2 family efflux MFS transporter permease subunit [Asticcacaulis sp. EMRT-3]MDI7774508.1 DHA2 family efflux MFS transporter permease subunit [Asticcacaulis sp. EMRT-3]